MGSKYALLKMNMSNGARILNLPKYTRLWANMPLFVQHGEHG